MVSLPPVNKAVLRTSYPPTPDTVAVAQKSLAEGLNKLQILGDEISRLHNLSNGLSLEKQQLTAFVDGHRALISPIHRLPPDVLQEIFYQCLPTCHNTVLSFDEPPLSLGRVCTRWKQVAYFTPKLWTMIHIAVPSASTVESPTLARRETFRREAISSWLSRSGTLPLSISIHSNQPAQLYGITNHLIQPYIDLISPHARRWAFIQLIFLDYDWTSFLSQFRATDVPLLESLHIEDQRGSGSVQGWDPRQREIAVLSQDCGIFQAARIRSLGLPGYIAYRLGVHMQWQGIKRLDIGDGICQCEKFVQIISQCSNLSECTLALNCPVDSRDQTPPLSLIHSRFTLQNLRKLTIITDPTKEDLVCDVLDRISAPALVHFAYERTELRGWHNEPIRSFAEESLVQSLGTFLCQLDNPLRELDLWLSALTESVLLDILKLVPGVKILSLAGNILSPPLPRPGWALGWPGHPSTRPLTEFLLRHFTPSPRPDVGTQSAEEKGMEIQTYTCLCPNLEVLSLPDTLFSKQTVFEFLRSRTVLHRQNSVARLRKASFISFSPLPLPSSEQVELDEVSDMQAELLALEKETGLQAYLQYPRRESEANPTDSLPVWQPDPYDGALFFSAKNGISFQPFFSSS